MKKITSLFLFGFAFCFNSNAQNTCLTAASISTGSHTVAVINGTEIPSPICAPNGPGASAGEWYSFTATVDGVANVTTDLPANSGGDTRVHIYTGSCGSLVCVGGNDDVSGSIFLSNITWPVSSGVTYTIAFDNRWSSAGFDFDLTETPVTCPSTFPINEDFDSHNQFYGCYTVEDTDGDGSAWIQKTLKLDISSSYFNTFAQSMTSGSSQNHWLFSPPITLISGADYTIDFKFNGNDSANPANESLEVLLIDAAASTGNVLTSLFSATGIVQTGTLAQLETLATAPSINYTSTASGTYYLAFRITSPANAAFLLLFEYSIDQTLGIGDFETNTFKHFFNKDSDILTLDSSKASFDNIELFNLVGQRVLNKNLSRSRETIDLSSLNDGIYIGKVRIENSIQTIKILIR